jgi:hypothetical protein
MKIPGIHVCQVVNGEVGKIDSFDVDVDGTFAAQAAFKEVLLKRGVDENDINEAIEKGFYRCGDFGLSIEAPIHS